MNPDRSNPSPAAPPPHPTATLEDLENELTTLAGHLNAGNYRFLKLLSEFDRREGYAGWGIVSCAHWLSWKCGISLVAARERCRVARALDELPLISEAMRCGSISYCKVRALTRVATRENERQLLQLAQHGTVTHVEKTVRMYRSAQRSEELDRANRQHRDRQLQYFVDDDGCFVLRGRLDPEQGAMVCRALEAAAHELNRAQRASREARAADEPSDEPREPAAALRADALALLAESFLAHGAAALAAGDRHLVHVHVAEQVLRDAAEAGRSELADATSVPPATIRRLCCDASLVPLVESAEGIPLNVGRKTRAVPPAVHRALVARDVGCRYPGCTNTRYVDAHHIVHWADGGETSLENLTLLCRRHHRYVHELGYTLERCGKRLRFVRPDGRHVPDVPVSDGWLHVNRADVLVHTHVRARLGIDAETATPRWDGSSPDYQWVVSRLCRSEGSLLERAVE